MITFSMKKGVKNIPFKIETDEETIQLEFTANTIADSLRISRIQGKYIDDEKLSDDDRTECYNLARLATCVKTPEGEYYWDEDIESLRGVFNGEMFFYMLAKCTEMNPVPVEGDTIESKKK